jgi:sarcosine oxidase
MRTCDVVIVGQGAHGSAARAFLRRAGARVIALEQATPGHAGGSSHGESRITRRSNFENPAYAPVIQRSMDLWFGIEREPGDIFVRAGLLEAGPQGCDYLSQTRAAATAGGVPIDEMTPADVDATFPAIRLPRDWAGVFQPDAGYLRADRAIARFQEASAGPGSELLAGVSARSVEQIGDGVEVVTTGGEAVQAGAAIIAAGPWAADLVPELAPYQTLTRQVLGWYAPADPGPFEAGRFPVFLFDTEGGMIFGFPQVAGFGVKMASHEHGRVLVHADQARQDASIAELSPMRAAAADMLAGLPQQASRVATCIYANTPDEEFIIDRRPGRPRIVFASACSGHGFKFATAIGEALADLALGTAPRLDLTPFRLARFNPPA